MYLERKYRGKSSAMLGNVMAILTNLRNISATTLQIQLSQLQKMGTVFSTIVFLLLPFWPFHDQFWKYLMKQKRKCRPYWRGCLRMIIIVMMCALHQHERQRLSYVSLSKWRQQKKYNVNENVYTTYELHWTHSVNERVHTQLNYIRVRDDVIQ